MGYTAEEDRRSLDSDGLISEFTVLKIILNKAMSGDMLTAEEIVFADRHIDRLNTAINLEKGEKP